MRLYEFAETNTSTLLPNQTSTTKNINTNLSYNLEFNPQVKTMQAKLVKIGYDVGPPGIDGKYGPWTAAAVRAFKTDYQIPSSEDSMSSSELNILDQIINGTRARTANPTKPTVAVNTNRAGTPVTSGQLISQHVRAANPNPQALPKQNIINALDRAASELGIIVQITPEGGRAARKSGTKNHPAGDAADFQIIHNNTLYRYKDDPQGYENMIKLLIKNARGRANIGIGRYNWGVHYDESSWRQASSSPPVTTWS